MTLSAEGRSLQVPKGPNAAINQLSPPTARKNGDVAAGFHPMGISRGFLRSRIQMAKSKAALSATWLRMTPDIGLAGAGEVCRRLMTTPGVGPVVVLTFRATVDVPSRFTSSKAVGAAFGLTPRRQQSGEIDRMGGISKCGDAMMRKMLLRRPWSG